MVNTVLWYTRVFQNQHGRCTHTGACTRQCPDGPMGQQAYLHLRALARAAEAAARKRTHARRCLVRARCLVRVRFRGSTARWLALRTCASATQRWSPVSRHDSCDLANSHWLKRESKQRPHGSKGGELGPVSSASKYLTERGHRPAASAKLKR